MEKSKEKERLEVLLEDLNEKMSLSLEQTSELLKLKPTVEKLGEDMEIVKSDIIVLKVGHKQMAQDIKEIKVKLDKKEDKTVAQNHERRITHLENRI